MNEDKELAELLGDAPASPDPGFRFEVFARVARRARQRAASQRAAAYAAGFTLVGLAFPAAGAAGLTFGDLQPLLLAGGILALMYVSAALAIDGPAAALARSRVLLRAHP